jgi:hypothetical protein
MPSVPGAGDRSRVEAQIRRWQDQVLDLTRTNPLIGLNRSRVAKLQVAAPLADPLFAGFIVDEKEFAQVILQRRIHLRFRVGEPQAKRRAGSSALELTGRHPQRADGFAELLVAPSQSTEGQVQRGHTSFLQRGLRIVPEPPKAPQQFVRRTSKVRSPGSMVRPPSRSASGGAPAGISRALRRTNGIFIARAAASPYTQIA